MISSMIRSTMKTALWTPASEMRTGPHSTRFLSPGVKKRFKSPVKTMMNSTGLRPRTNALMPTLEMRTHTASVRASTP